VSAPVRHPHWCRTRCLVVLNDSGVPVGAHRSDPERVSVGERMLSVELVRNADPGAGVLVLLSVYGDDPGDPEVVALAPAHARLLGAMLDRHGRTAG